MMPSNLTPIPELYVSYESSQKLKIEAGNLVSLDLTPRQICDLELLMNGGFNPLKGFLSEEDYDGVVENMRLADGSLWPMPINLDVSEAFAEKLELGQDIALRDQEGVILATMTITDRWTPNKAREAEKVFGADDDAHPAVNYLHNQAGNVYLGGPVTGIQQPVHYDFRARRDTPNELRAYFRKLGWRRVVAFQTRNPLHRAHQELTFRAAREAQANLLIHPVVGMTKPGDVDHFTRVRCYEAVLDKYPAATTSMSLLNLAMRMAGPREAVWHGLIRKNHGCTHFIVGRDHAGPGKNSAGEDFYGPYDAQDLFRAHQEEMGIEMVDFKHMVWVQERAQYEAMDEIEDKDSVTILNISGTELRRRLQEGLEIPDWFSFPEVVAELRNTRPPRSKQGFTVFFTGFSGTFGVLDAPSPSPTAVPTLPRSRTSSRQSPSSTTGRRTKPLRRHGPQVPRSLLRIGRVTVERAWRGFGPISMPTWSCSRPASRVSEDSRAEKATWGSPRPCCWPVAAACCCRCGKSTTRRRHC